MNIGLLMILLVLLIGGVLGITLIASSSGSTPAVDSYGRAASAQSNTTQSNLTAYAPVASTFAVFIILIVGAIIMFAAFIFLATGVSGGIVNRHR